MSDPRCTEVNDQGARCTQDAGHLGHHDVLPERWPQINPELLDALIAERNDLRAEVELWRNGQIGCTRRPEAGQLITGSCPDCGRAFGSHRRPERDVRF